jgi:FlaA1/EpsC-like NDP-sugar epimerase
MPSSFWRIALLRAARLFDLVAVCLAFLAAFALASGSFTWPSFADVLLLRVKIINFILFGSYLTVCSMIFSRCGFYLSHRLSHEGRRVRETLLATTLITAVLLVLPLGMDFADKTFFMAFWFLTFTVLILTRLIGQQLLYYARLRGRNLRSIVIVGEGPEVTTLADRIENEPTLGYRVVRIIDAKEV